MCTRSVGNQKQSSDELSSLCGPDIKCQLIPAVAGRLHHSAVGCDSRWLKVDSDKWWIPPERRCIQIQETKRETWCWDFCLMWPSDLYKAASKQSVLEYCGPFLKKVPCFSFGKTLMKLQHVSKLLLLIAAKNEHFVEFPSTTKHNHFSLVRTSLCFSGWGPEESFCDITDSTNKQPALPKLLQRSVQPGAGTFQVLLLASALGSVLHHLSLMTHFQTDHIDICI